MRKSQVQAEILNRVKRELIHQPLQLLTGVNVIGMTSATLGTMSRGAASLSKDDEFLRVRTNQVRPVILINFSPQQSDRRGILHWLQSIHYYRLLRTIFPTFPCSALRNLYGGSRSLREK